MNWRWFFAALPSCVAAVASNSSLSVDNREFVTIGGEARCLDGSPYKIWIWPGRSDQWSIGIRGGGWCFNQQECLTRAANEYGSSNAWTADTSWAGYTCSGLAGDCTRVFLGYCDGSSFSSYKASPSPEGLYFRGISNLDGTLAELLNNRGLRSAKEVVVWGGSAGGLSTLLHLDHIKETIQTAASHSVRVVGRPVAGYFLDYPPFPGSQVERYSDKVMHGDSMMGLTPSLSAACLSHYVGEEWKCFMAQYAIDFVQTPFFAANSRFDQFQLGENIGIDCISKQPFNAPYSPSNCTTAEQNAVVAFGQSWWNDFQHAFKDESNGRGFFVCNCIQHDVKCKIAGKTLNDIFADWYQGASRGKWVDLCGSTPCNDDTTCAPWHPTSAFV